MGMKRAREVLSATAEAATSEAPPNDPALPRNPPQPVPPPGRLLPPPRPPLPVPALPPAPAPGRPPPAGWLPPPAISMPRLAAPAAPPVWLLPQGRGLASARATSCATATWAPQLRPQGRAGTAATAGVYFGATSPHHCDRRARARHGRGGWPRNNLSFAAVPARPFRSLCSRCAVLHSLRVSRTDLLSPS